MKTFKIIMTVALFFACVSLTAQVNFSGTWNLNAEKSQFGGGPGGGGPGGGGPGGGGPGGGGGRMGGGPRVIIQSGNNLSVETTMRGFDGGEPTKMVTKYTLDGKPTENTRTSPMGDMTSKSTATWSADKKSLTIVTTMSFDGNEMKTTETWKLSADGKSMTIESVRPGFDGGEMKTTMVYDKQ
ncbi:MAG TPA: hypothetical protein PK719_08860 [Bacteroidales bacterium]|jgi:hypothetical protein|nr:MAG: hypothetical protein BWX96_01273 [Bacteroidetes bacterium ADurb.Bin145]HOU01486.1 hypothetical protein [Bacteroidales bacterium]HQG63756.1 hypothetical protein [Bacteroidales bacterium]HQK67647.1 hypothetical protein [Bacteroidales bacterium]